MINKAIYSFLLLCGIVYTSQLSNNIYINSTFFQSSLLTPFNDVQSISSLNISGKISLNTDSSLVRVILVDNKFIEYLVYEAYPLIVKEMVYDFSQIAEETHILPNVHPLQIKIEIYDASLTLDDLHYSSALGKSNVEIKQMQATIRKEINQKKIDLINEKIKILGLRWFAGETSISKLSFEKQRNMFPNKKVPNNQGFLYYKGGIFEFPSNNAISAENSSELIESWDWRNRHGANDPSSPYYDGDTTGGGWITPVGYQLCGDCWAWAATHIIEANLNLHFNQHLDIILSVKDVSCNAFNEDRTCCEEGNPYNALEYVHFNGIVDAECLPYSDNCESCTEKCTNSNELIIIDEARNLYPDDASIIKKALIDYGPMVMGIFSLNHAMALIGFSKDTSDAYATNRQLWLFKNSWGSGWGDNGFANIKAPLRSITNIVLIKSPKSLKSNLEKVCADFDADGFYNWGIGEKPDNCPNCPDRPDCDDTNDSVGPINMYGHCVPIEEIVYSDFIAETVVGVEPFSVQFVNQSIGDISNYYWDFGDNTTSTELNPTHVYEKSGTYSVSLLASGTGGEEEIIKNNYIEVIPIKFYLSQNYPNPFNSETTIEFGVPYNCDIKFIIYDLNGRELDILFEKNMSEGIHKFIFDAAGYPTGAYIIKLLSDDFTSSIKTLLIK